MRRTIEQAGEIALERDPVPYTLYRVAGRRHVHLVLSEDGRLQVRAPYRYSRREAEEVIRTHAAWVTRSLRSAQQLSARRPQLVSGTELPFVDERLQLELRAGGRARVMRRGPMLYLCGPHHDPLAVRELLETWYRGQARPYLGGRLACLAAVLGVRPGRLSIRSQRTRWGSCSAGGSISLNWRLVLLPSELSDYVLVHELCHLRHLNHSARFWAMVAGAVPDYRERCRRLRAIQHTLAL